MHLAALANWPTARSDIVTDPIISDENAGDQNGAFTLDKFANAMDKADLLFIGKSTLDGW